MITNNVPLILLIMLIFGYVLWGKKTNEKALNKHILEPPFMVINIKQHRTGKGFLKTSRILLMKIALKCYKKGTVLLNYWYFGDWILVKQSFKLKFYF